MSSPREAMLARPWAQLRPIPASAMIRVAVLRLSPRGRPCDSPDRRPLEGGARGESSRHFNFEEH